MLIVERRKTQKRKIIMKYGTESYNIYNTIRYLICGMQNGAKSKYIYIYTFKWDIYVYMPDPDEPKEIAPNEP